ncbi:Nose resistant to fluoxetine protein 6 [Oryzias melastigma]|uniref:Nose resistant to fluoxetine protein 6 n=1 Tax=Oryzias melastigma TaxID=30732 RepID=A0A834FGK2_ORYME|nr:Nose resistant to fluoxetine protein 6 [Oryzias melastigma]
MDKVQQINWTYVCFTRTSENYVLHYYVKPYTRYGPFLIGIMTGIHLKTKKKPLLRQKWQAALGWFCCLSVMALLVGLAYVLRETPAYPSLPHALYQALHRPVWALSVSWIILACEEGYGGFITNLLSLSFWVPLSNISFACYLVHPIFIILYNGLQETPIHYTDINFMYLFFGHLVLTLALSYILSLYNDDSVRKRIWFKGFAVRLLPIIPFKKGERTLDGSLLLKDPKAVGTSSDRKSS